MLRAIKDLFIESLRLFSFFISLVLLLYITVLQTLFFLFPDAPTITELVLNMPDLRFLVLEALFFAGIGWFLTFTRRKISFTWPTSLAKDETITYLLTAFFLSYFFANSFSIFSKTSNISVVIVTLLFFTFMPQIVKFYSTYRFPHLSTLQEIQLSIRNFRNLKMPGKSTLILIFLSLLLLMISTYSLVITTYKSRGLRSYQKMLREKFIIINMTPKRTTYAEKVSLVGHNFGWKVTNSYSLQSTYGPVITHSWTDEKIEFVIPLHWQDGEVDLWIEKPKNGVNLGIVRSNTVALTLLPRWDFYPEPGENKFERGVKRAMRIFYLDFWNQLLEKLPLKSYP